MAKSALLLHAAFILANIKDSTAQDIVVSVSTSEEMVTTFTPHAAITYPPTTPSTPRTTPVTTTMITTTIRQSKLKDRCSADRECRTVEQATCQKGVCRCGPHYYPSVYESSSLKCRSVEELSPLGFMTLHVEANSLRLQWRHSEYWNAVAESACYEVGLRYSASEVRPPDCVTSQSHEFRDLYSGTSYVITLRVRLEEGGVFKYTRDETRPVTTNTNVFNIVLPILIVVCVILVLGCLAYLFRKRVRSWLRQCMARCSATRTESVQLQRVLTPITSRPLKLHALKESVRNMHKDSDLVFMRIHDELRQYSPVLQFEAAASPPNVTKNRYNDVLPYDHCRVKLPVSSSEESDYINASYVPGFHGERQFIAAQGPLEETVADFWRMVWYEHSPVIVMLTQLTEKSKVKCHPYYPMEQETSLKSGEITIENISTSNLGHFSLSIYRLKKGGETQTVKHFICPDWPDHSSLVPEILVELVQKVQDYSTPDMPPIVVHCSAGVGRTGTYIAVDYVMNYIRENSLQDKIDIYAFVLKMRRFRPLMVQTADQYALIHDCAVLLVDRKLEEEQNQSEAGDSKEAISLEDAAIPQSDTVLLLGDEADGTPRSDAKKEAEVANGAVQQRGSYTNQALAEDAAAASAPKPSEDEAGSPGQSQESSESKADRSSKSGSLQGDDKSASAEDAASFHTVDLHSQGGSKENMTEGSKDSGTEDQSESSSDKTGDEA